MPRRRINLKKKENIIESTKDILSLVDKIYFINLNDRKDRLEEIQGELNKIDPQRIKTSRIEAIKKENGKLGCALSHLKALKEAQKNNYKNVLILEDDFQITKSKEMIEYSFNYLFDNFKDFNICLLAGNVYKQRKKTDVVYECYNVQTTSSYIIQSHFYQTLIDNFQEAVNKLENNPPGGKAEIDIEWKKLQGRDSKFYIFRNKLGKQRSGYSDIEKRHVDYNC